MTQKQIMGEVATSKWQPSFTFTDDLDTVVDSILKHHEDYFLNLHRKVKEIIEREIIYAKDINGHSAFQKQNFKGSLLNTFAKPLDPYVISFADACNWQKELFDYKIGVIEQTLANDGELAIISETRVDRFYLVERIKKLPNLYIQPGLRSNNVTVGEWNPPHPMFLNDLLPMIFPIIAEEHDLTMGNVCNETVNLYVDHALTEWYKVFQTIHPFNDLNGRVGGIIINILSYIYTGKYLISNH